MTPAQITFCELLAGIIVGLALSCWLGRCSRDGEVYELTCERNGLARKCDTLARSADSWEQTARDTEKFAKGRFAELEALLPKRGPGSQFAKKK